MDFEVTMKDLETVRGVETYDDVINYIDYIFENIIHVLNKFTVPGDLIRFVLQSPSLNYPISTNMLPADSPELTKLIIFEIGRVLNSKEHFTMHGLIINVQQSSSRKGLV